MGHPGTRLKAAERSCDEEVSRIGIRSRLEDIPSWDRPSALPPSRPDTSDCMFLKPKAEVPPRSSSAVLELNSSKVPLTTGYMSPFHQTVDGTNGSILPEYISRHSPRRGSYMAKGNSKVGGSRLTQRLGPDYLISKRNRFLQGVAEWAPRPSWAQEEPWRRRKAALRAELDASRINTRAATACSA